MPRAYARLSAAEGWAEAFAVSYHSGGLPGGYGYPRGYRPSPLLLGKVQSYFATKS